MFPTSFLFGVCEKVYFFSASCLLKLQRSLQQVYLALHLALVLTGAIFLKRLELRGGKNKILKGEGTEGAAKGRANSI